MTSGITFRRTRAIGFQVIHVLLTLATPFLLLALSSCIDEGAKPVDYGPQSDLKAVNAALNSIVRDSDPTQTKLGAFVFFQTVDEIAGGQSRVISAAVSQTVIQRDDSSDRLTFHLLENRTTAKADGKNEILSREFELPFSKSPPATPSPSPSPTSTPVAGLGAGLGAVMDATLNEAGLRGWIESLSMKPIQSSDASQPVTYHRLRSWESREPAPPLVAARPGCLGFADCLITYRHVSFDLISWSSGSGDITKVEFVTSPNVPQIAGYNITPIFPFMPGLVRSCITELVGVGTSGARTMVTECQKLNDFLFEQKPTP